MKANKINFIVVVIQTGHGFYRDRLDINSPRSGLLRSGDTSSLVWMIAHNGCLRTPK